MSCLICGTVPTIKSHLIPKVFAREVQVGKAHALVRSSEDFDTTQSGIFERGILCKTCDNELGKFENYAAMRFRKIRQDTKASHYGLHVLSDTSGDNILRFAAGLLWKYSVASQESGRINLGPYSDILRDIAFSQKTIPKNVDAIVVRLKTHDEDDGVFAYRAPAPDRKENVNGYRILVGGMFIFVKLDQQVPHGGAFEHFSIAGKSALPYTVIHAQHFEEYQLAEKLVHNGRLSDFLDKQTK